MSNRPTLIIGNYTYSSWSLRAWLFLRQFGVAFDEIRVPLFTPEAAQRLPGLSPSRRVPVLRHADLVVWDSLAIGEYVNEVFLDGAGWPADRAQRALARSLCAEMHSGFTDLRDECPMNVGRRRTNPLALGAGAQRDLERVGEIWRGTRRLHGDGGEFLFGRFGLVDAFYAPVATRIRSYALPAGAVEQRYVEAIYALPAMREWLAAAARESERLEKYELIGA
jgi:glutathione S-transferase